MLKRRIFASDSLLAAALVFGFLFFYGSRAFAFSLWPHDLPKQPELYRIDGYLDRAPEKTEILDRIQISANGHLRELLVTWYGTPGETSLDRQLSRSMAQPYQIQGPDDQVRELGDAPAGTKIEGTFAAYTDGPPWLLIAELAFPAS